MSPRDPSDHAAFLRHFACRGARAGSSHTSAVGALAGLASMADPILGLPLTSLADPAFSHLSKTLGAQAEEHETRSALALLDEEKRSHESERLGIEYFHAVDALQLELSELIRERWIDCTCKVRKVFALVARAHACAGCVSTACCSP